MISDRRTFLGKKAWRVGSGSHLDLWRAQLRVVQSSGWKSRHGKKPEPCSVDGRGWWKRCLLKPIDKVCNRQASNYPGCNESERRSSLVKVQIHWPSLSQIGEDRILLPYWLIRYKDGDGVSAATRIERGTINWGSPPRP